jgi:hypothetical protein
MRWAKARVPERKQRLMVRFLAPSGDAVEATRRATLPATFAAHVRLRIAAVEDRRALLRVRRRHATWLGLGVLVAGTALARAVASGYPPPPFSGLLQQPLAEAMSFVGRVAPWVPLEAWLIAPVELRQELRLLRLCAALPLEVVSTARPARGPTGRVGLRAASTPRRGGLVRQARFSAFAPSPAAH